MDQIVNISDWYLFQGVNNVIGFQRIVKPALMGGIADLAAIEACMPDAQRVFKELGRLLGGQEYFAGEVMTLADIAVACQMDFLAVTPEWDRLTEENVNLDRLARTDEHAAKHAGHDLGRVSAKAKAA